MTTEKATNYLLNNQKLGEVCATNFPPKIEYKEGEPVTKLDTTYLPGDSIPCPPDSTGNIVYIPTNPKLIIKETIRIDTAKVTDPAMENWLRRIITEKDNKIGEQVNEIMILESELKQSRKWRNIFGCILGGGLLFVGIMVFLRFKSIV